MTLRLLFALLVSLCLLAPAQGQTLHPALWHVRGKLGEIWLFGSIHILPPDLKWHTDAIDRAMKSADVFVFEVPIGDTAAQQHIQALVAARGFLPPGQSLPALLSPTAKADLDAALTTTGLPAAQLDRERPWLVSLQLMVARLAQEKYAAANGVDQAVMTYAASAGKPSRYFETIEQQFDLIAPQDDKLEIEEFESDLGEIHHMADEIGPLVEAWGQGNVQKIDALVNGELKEYPEAKAALLDDRNRRWALQIQTMLTEKRRFFITVGAGHLVGPQGVPALLRKEGYPVDGP
jgi:uncharacterized protein YbaP (TraB family)